MPLRDATDQDLPAITAIYAHHVLTGTGTSEATPPGQAEMAQRLARIQQAGWAWLVAEEEGAVLGFGFFQTMRDGAAYRYAAEDQIYVRHDVHGQGLGKSLVAGLLERAEAAGFRQVLAVIGDSENVGSVGLHLSLGFRQVGLLRATGFKFGRWMDVVVMQRTLGAGDKSIPAE
ncbi:GNAT family N-acetyltransferase [Roseomonas sp. 18066]|uniref:GNAT family N-acetyltransferase n=1 Tax=Roseomonas sp. 18066 TaxID=2681412 RepID=UPI0013590BD1|nr:GNAT family N-acetyltransferase [Roseomonas sp. 18066]